MKLWRWLTTPEGLRTTNLWFTGLWAILILPTVFWWRDSVFWVALVSIWANVISHFTAYIASRVDVRAEDIHEAVKRG